MKVNLKARLDQLVADGSLTQEVANAISADVDAIKSNATSELQTQLNAAREQLAPFIAQERNAAIKKQMPKNVKEEYLDDLIVLAGITDEDTEEAIQTKLKESLEKRPHMQGEVQTQEQIKDPLVSKTQTKNTTNSGKEEKETEVESETFPELL